MAEKEVAVKKEGLGGWMILPTVYFFISLFLMGFLATGVFTAVMSIFVGIEGALGNLASSSMHLISFALILTTIIFEFKKKQIFPKFAIITLWAVFILTSLNAIIFLEFTVQQVLKDVAMPVILTLYLLKSQRVKNTFIN